MSRLTVFVGLDYHPGSVQGCVLDVVGKVLANGTRSNDAAELDQAVRQFGAGIQAAIEVSPGVRELRELVRYRQQLVERRRATKLRIRAVALPRTRLLSGCWPRRELGW